MKADALKKSILQYAMQGKLVPQNPQDEPASELLKRIKAEKDQLIKDGKIKKEKPLPPITQDEIPYDLPQGWEQVRLGDIVKISTGKHDANHARDNGRYAFYTCSYTPMKCDTYSYEGAGIILPGNGANVGLSIYYEGLFDVYQRTYVLQQYTNDFFLKYIHYSLLSNWKEYNTNKMYGGATPYIKLSNIQNYIVLLPPLAEQKRIVEKLEEILPLVDEYGKNEEILSEMNQKLPKQIRQSILQYAVQGKLVEQNPQDEPASELLKRIKAEKDQLVKEGKIKKEKPLPPITQDEIPYDLPQCWQWVRLGNVVNYGSTGTIDSRENLNENTWILDLEDIEKESSKLLVKNIIKNKSFNSSKKIFKKGDVLYGKLRPYLDKVIVAEENGICTTEIIPLRIYYGIDSYYLKWFLKSPMFIQYVNQLTYGVKMPRLGTEDGKNALFALPPLAEQKRIVAKVEELLNLVDKLEVS